MIPPHEVEAQVVVMANERDEGEDELSSNWPLIKIPELHATNDVLFPSDSNTNNNSNHNKTTSSTPDFRSHKLSRHGHHNNSTNNNKGNQRFHALLQDHLASYATANQIQRPVMALQVLTQWRQQTPPGRFLVQEIGSHPPLYRDIGDKKARAKISKALKRMMQGEVNPFGVIGHDEKMEALSHDPTPCSHDPTTSSSDKKQQKLSEQLTESNKRSSSDETAATAEPTETQSLSSGSSQSGLLPESLQQPPTTTHIIPTLPAAPSRSKPARRSVSTAIHETKQLFGRQLELEQMTAIYRDQQLRRRKRLRPGSINKSGEIPSCTMSHNHINAEATDMILVSGELGTGKSSLVQAWVREAPSMAATGDDIGVNNEWQLRDDDDDGEPTPCSSRSKLAQEPLFLQANFEPLKWAEPYKALFDLIEDCALQLRQKSPPRELKALRKRLRERLQEEVALLVNLAPACKDITSSGHNDKPALSSMDESVSAFDTSSKSIGASRSNAGALENVTKQRMEQVIIQFFQATSAIFPLVVILEDLQWASESAMAVLGHLVDDHECSSRVLFAGTYRTDTKMIKQFFWKRLDHWRETHHLNLTEINLPNLTREAIHHLLAHSLQLVQHESQSLCDLLFEITKGNPLFLTEVLRILQRKGALYFDEASEQWTCDIDDTIGIKFKNVHSVLDLWKARAKALPKDAQETLKLVSSFMDPCIEEGLLALVLPGPDPALHLNAAERLGLVQHVNGSYVFNEITRQAIHEMIPEKDRPAYHLKLGRTLWNTIDFNGDMTCSGVGYGKYMIMQLFMSRDLITREEDKRAIATLFYKAGTSASKSFGFNTAWFALNIGVSMMVEQEKTWGKENYDLSLSLFNATIEIGHINGSFAEVDQLITEVLKNVRMFEDSLIARLFRVKIWGSKKKEVDAIKFAMETLERLGERIPQRPSNLQVFVELRRIGKLLKGKSDEELMEIHQMRDRSKLAAMQVLAQVYLYVCFTDHKLLLMCGFRMVELTVKYGLSPMSSIGFGIYGMARSDDGSGMRYGRLAMAIAEKYKNDTWIGQASCAYYGILYFRERPVKECVEPLLRAYRLGLRAGDIEGALLNGCLRIWNTQDLMTLPELERNCRDISSEAKYHGQSMSVALTKPVWQYCLNLMGQGPADPKYLRGEMIDKDLEDAKLANFREHHLLIWADLYALKLAYLFGDFDLAEQHVSGAKWIHKNYAGSMAGAYAITYHSLFLLAQAGRNKKRFFCLRQVKQNLKALQKAVTGCPENFLGKQVLVEAELAAVCGDNSGAYSKFRLAILQNRDSGYWMEEALANEKLGRLYLDHERDSDAIPFLQKAQFVYEKWGATTKAGQLAEEFGDIINIKNPFEPSKHMLRDATTSQ